MAKAGNGNGSVNVNVRPSRRRHPCLKWICVLTVCAATYYVVFADLPLGNSAVFGDIVDGWHSTLIPLAFCYGLLLVISFAAGYVFIALVFGSVFNPKVKNGAPEYIVAATVVLTLVPVTGALAFVPTSLGIAIVPIVSAVLGLPVAYRTIRFLCELPSPPK